MGFIREIICVRHSLACPQTTGAGLRHNSSGAPQGPRPGLVPLHFWPSYVFTFYHTGFENPVFVNEAAGIVGGTHPTSKLFFWRGFVNIVCWFRTSPSLCNTRPRRRHVCAHTHLHKHTHKPEPTWPTGVHSSGSKDVTEHCMPCSAAYSALSLSTTIMHRFAVLKLSVSAKPAPLAPP